MNREKILQKIRNIGTEDFDFDQSKVREDMLLEQLYSLCGIVDSMSFLGCDIEEVERFRNASASLLDKIFTQAEQNYCCSKLCSERHFAARFCTKEAVVKALSRYGFGGITCRDIEVVKDKNLPRIYHRGI
ncbi:MAG: 4'-phosphopantetheinyl transferase superfamily protein [Holosporaceae bacterium]|jgi:hypothetical protein|nr:4'-phosphopantetheinyl transferase superfamily protein [Holosporaceae bacterium]